MTSSILNDSLQALLESSHQGTIDTLDAIKAELKQIYEEDPQFPDDLLRDANNFYSILQKIEDAKTHHEKTEIVLTDFQATSKTFLNKYSEFLSSELIKTISKYTEYFLGLAYISKVGEVLDTIFYITDLKEQSSLLLTVILELSKIIESYIDHFNEDILKGIKNIALDKIKWSYSSTNSEEIKHNFLIIRQVSRGILYQIEHYEKEKKSTIGDLLEWMKTGSTWKGDDFEECLDYVNEMRK